MNFNYVARQAHPYHQVDVSPWPFLMSMALLSAALGVVSWLGLYPTYHIIPQLLIIAVIAALWFRDILREAKGGYHTLAVQRGIMIGFQLFLLSEIMLFASFFWAYLHASLAPSVEQGSVWPPVGIHAIDPWGIPLLGSCILLASGFILTLGHHAFVQGNKDLALVSLFFTVVLGFLFVFLQLNEYYYSQFTIADSVLGGVLYLTTGLHGVHVFCGAAFLLVALIRVAKDSMTTSHALNFDFAAWYWHLVDVVWLALFILFYIWGGGEASTL